MSYLTNNLVVDFEEDSTSMLPTVRFTRLILYQTIHEGANRIVLSIEEGADISSPPLCALDPNGGLSFPTLERVFENESKLCENKFHITYLVDGIEKEMECQPTMLFPAIVAVLCNYASVPYYSKGHVEGVISVKNPNVTLTLESDNLMKKVTLVKT